MTRVLVVLCGAWLLAIVPGVSTAQRGSAPARTGPTFDELYARGLKLNAGLTTLTARFTETTTSSLLKAERPLVERGRLYIQRASRRVALHYTDPPDRVVIIDGDTMVRSIPSQKILDRRDIGAAQKRVQKYFEGSDPGELRRVFDVTLLDKSGRPGTREMNLAPKRKQIKEALANLDLWVEESSGLLNAMRMTFSNGDIKLMEFSEVVQNAPIDARVFSAPK
jgi:outer membrane lipoprotein-sorting protein